MSGALFLSPHLDDAALSCPAAIRGAPSHVATIFTEGDASYAGRRAEDARALALLGVEPIHLGLRDAPFRHPHFSSFTALLLERRADPEALEQAKRAIAELLARLQPERVYAPLGVGGHVDHRLVHDAARAVVPREQLTFYEDRPYALVPGATAARLLELGADVELDRPALARALLDAPYVRTYLKPRDLVPLAHAIRRGRGAPTRWRSEIAGFHRSDLELAMEVGQAYASQWRDFHGSREAHARMLDAGATELGCDGGYAERFWSLEG